MPALTETAPLMPDSISLPTIGRPALPESFTYTTPAPALHYQGAEALLYRTHYLLAPPLSSSQDASTQLSLPSLPAALKHRPSKPYRHPLLDARLTRHRILSEARVLVKLRKEGVAVPALYSMDWDQGWMLCEWIEGGTVRRVLDKELDAFVGAADGEKDATGGVEDRKSGLWGLMGRIGKVVGRCHEVGVVHGDLTTSNLMLRPREQRTTDHTQEPEEMNSTEGDVVLIDFGLSLIHI